MKNIKELEEKISKFRTEQKLLEAESFILSVESNLLFKLGKREELIKKYLSKR